MRLQTNEEYIDRIVKDGLVTEEERPAFELMNLLAVKPFYCKKCDMTFPYYATLGKAVMKTENLKESEWVPLEEGEEVRPGYRYLQDDVYETVGETDWNLPCVQKSYSSALTTEYEKKRI